MLVCKAQGWDRGDLDFAFDHLVPYNVSSWWQGLFLILSLSLSSTEHSRAPNANGASSSYYCIFISEITDICLSGAYIPGF